MTAITSDEVASLWRDTLDEYHLLSEQQLLHLEIIEVKRCDDLYKRAPELFPLMQFDQECDSFYSAKFCAFYTQPIDKIDNLALSEKMIGTVFLAKTEDELVSGDYELDVSELYIINEEGPVMNEYLDYLEYSYEYNLDLLELDAKQLKKFNLHPKIESFLVQMIKEGEACSLQQQRIDAIAEDEKAGNLQSFSYKGISTHYENRTHDFISAGEVYFLEITLLGEFKPGSEIPIAICLLVNTGRPVRITKYKGHTTFTSLPRETEHVCMTRLGRDEEFLGWLSACV